MAVVGAGVGVGVGAGKRGKGKGAWSGTIGGVTIGSLYGMRER